MRKKTHATSVRHPIQERQTEWERDSFPLHAVLVKNPFSRSSSLSVLACSSSRTVPVGSRYDTSSSIHCACPLAVDSGQDCISAVLLSFGDIKVHTEILVQFQPHLLTFCSSPPTTHSVEVAAPQIC